MRTKFCIVRCVVYSLCPFCLFCLLLAIKTCVRNSCALCWCVEIKRRTEEDYEVDDITTSEYFPFCHEATQPLTGGWRLFYFETLHWHRKKQIRISAKQPFRKAYTSPMPMYLSTIRVCHNGTTRLCQAKKDVIYSGEDSDECPDDNGIK